MNVSKDKNPEDEEPRPALGLFVWRESNAQLF